MPARPGDAANSYCGRFVRWRVSCDRRIYELENDRRNNRGVVACQRGASFGGRLRRGFHTPKTEMIGSRVDFAFAAGADDVARAVLVVAEK